MEAQQFTNGASIQVGGLCTSTAQTVEANVSTTAFTADKLIEIKEADGGASWFLIGTGTLEPAEDNGVMLSAYERTRPFILKAGQVIEATTKIQINTCDVEGA